MGSEIQNLCRKHSKSNAQGRFFFKFCGLFRKPKQKLSKPNFSTKTFIWLVSSCMFSNWSLYGKNKKKGSDTDLDEAMIEYFISYFSRFLFYSEDFHNFFFFEFVLFFSKHHIHSRNLAKAEVFHRQTLGWMWKMGLR